MVISKQECSILRLFEILGNDDEATLDNVNVMFLRGDVEVLLRVVVMVVELQPSKVRHVVSGYVGHVPAKPCCAPPRNVDVK